MRIECRPISAYPVPETRNRRAAPFYRVRWQGGGRDKASLTDSLNLLEREALELRCRHLIIEADFREGQIRQDGWPYANARPSSPRVVVSMPETRHGPLRYPCDTFNRFEDNVRAIALALEALRKVERYGVTRRGEQYAGWRALPAQSGETLTTEAARAIIDRFGGTIRDALFRSHPDHGGTAESFDLVQRARKVLSL